MKITINRHFWMILIKVTISISLIVFLLSQVDLQKLSKYIEQSNKLFLILGAFLYVSLNVIDAIRFYVLKSAQTNYKNKDTQGTNLSSILDFTKINYASLAVSNLGLGVIGSELYKAIALKPHFGGYAESTLSVFVIRFIAFITTITICMASAFFLGLMESIFGQLITTLLKYKSTLFLFFLGVTVIALIAFLIKDKVKNLISYLLAETKKIRFHLGSKPGLNILKLVITSVIIDIIRAMFLLMFLAAYNGELNVWQLVFASTVSTLIVLLPFTWNGLGVREVSLVSLLMAFGIDAELALAAALSSRFTMFVMSFFGFFLIDFKIKRN